MPRRRGADGGGEEPPASAPKPRARKKKEAGAATPSSHDPAMKMDGGAPANYTPMMGMMFDGVGSSQPMMPSAQAGMHQSHPMHNGPHVVGGMPPHIPPGSLPDESMMPPGAPIFPPGGHGGGPVSTPGGMPPEYFFNHQVQPNPGAMYCGPIPPQPQQAQHIGPPPPQQFPPEQEPPTFIYQSPPVQSNQPMPAPPQPPQPLPHGHFPPPHVLPPQLGGPSPHPGIPMPMMMSRIAPTEQGPNFPQPPFLEFRLQEMNRRLFAFSSQQHDFSIEQHCQWWEAFAHEFFDDRAQLTIEVFDESIGCNRKYTICRLLIPRFYRTIFDSGTKELYYLARTAVRERYNPQQQPMGLCALDCDNLLMVTKFDKPVQTEVHTDCKLWLEFAPFEDRNGYRVKHWSMQLQGSQEFYQFNSDSNQLSPERQDLLRRGITRAGLPPQVHHYLKLCTVLEPMQLIMLHDRDMNLPPRKALEYLCFKRHQMQESHQQQQQQAAIAAQQMNQVAMMNHQQQQQQGSMPPTPIGGVKEEGAGGKAKQPRKRQRKTTAGSGGGGACATGTPSKKGRGGSANAAAVAACPPLPPSVETPPPNVQSFTSDHQFAAQPMYPHDVMTVGEPSMMGCEFGEEDERAITRVENMNYAESNAAGTHMLMNSMPNPNMPMGGGGGPSKFP